MAPTSARATRNATQAEREADSTSAGAGAASVESGPDAADTADLRHVAIPQGAMQDAAYARNWWRVVFDSARVPYHRLVADVSVWGPNEAKLRAGDLVEVLDEQSTHYALLYLVEHIPAKLIRFAELIKAPLGGRAVSAIEARGHYYAQWRGPAKRWCIIGPTGMIVRDGVLTKEEAERDVTTRNMPTSMAFVSHPRM